MRSYYVYVMASASRVLYVGVTGDLMRRVWQHRHREVEGFTSRYNVTKLVYFEETADVVVAIAREKQVKGWLRKRKVELIETENPTWRDLAQGWFT